jgi:hypothetical protein
MHPGSLIQLLHYFLLRARVALACPGLCMRDLGSLISRVGDSHHGRLESREYPLTIADPPQLTDSA